MASKWRAQDPVDGDVGRINNLVCREAKVSYWNDAVNGDDSFAVVQLIFKIIWLPIFRLKSSLCPSKNTLFISNIHIKKYFFMKASLFQKITSHFFLR